MLALQRYFPERNRQHGSFRAETASWRSQSRNLSSLGREQGVTLCPGAQGQERFFDFARWKRAPLRMTGSYGYLLCLQGLPPPRGSGSSVVVLSPEQVCFLRACGRSKIQVGHSLLKEMRDSEFPSIRALACPTANG